MSKDKPEKKKFSKSSIEKDQVVDTIKVKSKFEDVEEFLSNLYDFRYNIVSNSIEFRKKEDEKYSELNEHNIYRLLQHNRITFSLPNLKSLMNSDFILQYDPFFEYFEKLPPHDGIDHIKNLASCIKAREPERFAFHLEKMFIRIVQCAIDEKYFNKHAIILVGKRHNSGKSTLCRWLCPPALSTHITETIDKEKDSQIALSENLIINLDELAVFSKQEINFLKAMLSRDRVKIRHPFGSRAITTPRRASFIGSTNNDDFLTDATGSARWLCFEIDEIDWKYSKEIDIDKVYSQAYDLYKKGMSGNLSGKDIEENEEINKKYQKLSVEVEIIQRYFKPGTEKDGNVFYTATEVYERIKTETGSIYSLRVDNIGRALTQLGFDKCSGRRRDKENPFYGYYCIEIYDSNISENEKQPTTVTTIENEETEEPQF